MGKKKQQVQHVTESMGQMVSRAALNQLQQPIAQMVGHSVDQLGQRLALKQAQTTQMMFTRIVAIEKLLIDKNILTMEDLQNKVADIEDERDGVVQATDALQKGDLARISVRTKDAAAEAFESETTKLKVNNAGSGDTMGTEIEGQMIGMTPGETKVITFGDGKLQVEVTIGRLSRPVPPPAPAPAAQPQEGTDASGDQV
jgi:hypothetical protein